EIGLLRAPDLGLERLDGLAARLELGDPRAKPLENAGQLVLGDAVAPGERLDPGEPRLDELEPRGIGLEAVAIVDQRARRLAELDLDVREQFGRLAQRFVVRDEPIELLPGPRGERMCARLGFVERLD